MRSEPGTFEGPVGSNKLCGDLAETYRNATTNRVQREWKFVLPCFISYSDFQGNQFNARFWAAGMSSERIALRSFRISAV